MTKSNNRWVNRLIKSLKEDEYGRYGDHIIGGPGFIWCLRLKLKKQRRKGEQD